MYIFTDGDAALSISFIDENYHLWTIEDAKDGDVLAHSSFMFDDFIFIYNNTSILQAYCYYYSNERNRFIIEDRGHHCPWNMQDVTPATKEQRELLFQKMHEAGYEWDGEKKELKKITSYCQEYCKGYQETGKCFVDGECQAKKNAELSWSEEDEKKFRDVIRLVEQGAPVQSMRDHYTNWLKSLKLQNKWKPSDEHMNGLHNAISVLTDLNEHSDAYILDDLYEDLKKLKEN